MQVETETQKDEPTTPTPEPTVPAQTAAATAEVSAEPAAAAEVAVAAPNGASEPVATTEATAATPEPRKPSLRDQILEAKTGAEIDALLAIGGGHQYIGASARTRSRWKKAAAKRRKEIA